MPALNSASQARVISFARTIANDYGRPGTRANDILPSLAETEISRSRLKEGEIWDEVMAANFPPFYPPGRVGQPIDVANAALFFASDEAAWITGAEDRKQGCLEHIGRYPAEPIVHCQGSTPEQQHPGDGYENTENKTMTDYKDIIYEVKDQVATLTINRPKVLNAFTGDTIVEMEDAITAAGRDPDVGVLVLTGSGERAFCVGGDVNWEAKGGLEESINFRINTMIMELPKPVIARVNGYSIGGGNHIAYFCDITVAAEHAIFGQNGPRVGSPASGYIVAFLANVVGQKRAREMWMGCRKYTAQEMLQWGLVNSVVPMEKLDEEVQSYVNDFLSLSPTCLKLVKKTYRHHIDSLLEWDIPRMIDTYAPGYFETGEQDEGAAAFLEKRPPNFSAFRKNL